MAENTKQARAAFDTLCRMLDDHNWHYEKDMDSLTVHSGVQGDDLPIELSINVDAERQLVILLSPMPFTVPEDKRKDLALAVSAANYNMVDGSFDYDYTRGRIVFRMTSSFRESLVGKDLFEYMLVVSCNTIDEYNDKFLIVAKKEMSLNEIIEYMK